MKEYDGKIIKGIAGFYYVDTPDGVFQCRARGLFRNRDLKPLAGDNVRIELTGGEDVEGNVIEILERKNSLIRPPVANIDQALILFAMHSPEPVWGLLDRFLLNMAFHDIPCIICINKDDLQKGDEADRIADIYRDSGCTLIFTSALKQTGTDELKSLLCGKTTTVAGPSGAGKSSIINALLGKEQMPTGALSARVERGKQTTRHTELIPIAKDTYIFDSPGFSSLDLPDIKAEDLRDHFPEFLLYNTECRYNMCSHTHEPGCSVKQAVEDGKINAQRYSSYVAIYDQLKGSKRYT
ncbi:MAG: ribosome small subunit-dependent GTPase A [Lachnospiraceae bacterium]|nr:ribosome small subunit-dependent GTPase A [Lachnospiraceae bacterium]